MPGGERITTPHLHWTYSKWDLNSQPHDYEPKSKPCSVGAHNREVVHEFKSHLCHAYTYIMCIQYMYLCIICTRVWSVKMLICTRSIVE